MSTSRTLTRLRAAGERYQAAKAELDAARKALIPAMVAALRDPEIRQTAVIELSGYTRDRVRTIARENGIEPR